MQCCYWYCCFAYHRCCGWYRYSASHHCCDWYYCSASHREIDVVGIAVPPLTDDLAAEMGTTLPTRAALMEALSSLAKPTHDQENWSYPTRRRGGSTGPVATCARCLSELVCYIRYDPDGFDEVLEKVTARGSLYRCWIC